MQNEKRYAIITKLSGRQQNIRVWRSLVSRLNGVQEALSSNLNTRTKEASSVMRVLLFCFQVSRTQCLLHLNKRPKAVTPQSGGTALSSNLNTRTILTKRYRCVWRKARRINRFRAFSGLDSFFQTIDANRRFRASALIRTGRFPFSGRCIQPVPFLNGVFSDWQRCFSQKRITKIRAPFCWS